MALKDLCTKDAADKGIEIELYHPGTGKPLGIVVTMLGSDSQEFIDADHKIKNRNLALAKKKRDFTLGMEPEAVEAAVVEKMTACFLGWKEAKADGTYKDTVEFEQGVELAATKAEFKKIIADRGFFWMRAQLQEEMDRVTNFLPKQKGTSGSVPPGD